VGNVFLKHQYSDNHKIVQDSPHNFCNGGGAYADGGDVEKPSLVDRVKGAVGDLVDKAKGAIDTVTGHNPVSSGNPEHPEEGVGGATRKSTQDSVIDKESG